MFAWAATSQDVVGLWRTADKDAIVKFDICPDDAAALCGTIVWEVDAGKPGNTCGVRIAMLRRFDGEAWRDGWVFDPRTDKRYKGAIRTIGDDLTIRAYIGAELFGQTEHMTKEQSIPSAPKCRP